MHPGPTALTGRPGSSEFHPIRAPVMPRPTIRRNPASPALASLALAATLLLATLPAPASALEPPRPLPAYRPAFVTEVDGGAVEDCLWASSAMLLDKWSNGSVTVTRQQLRRLSGDHRGGSNFGNVRTAFDKLGFVLRYSPDGGDRMTWQTLLNRLASGAGAVVLGDYSALPRRFARWDPKFWRNTGEKDNHAMYLDRYDPRTGRVRLMDPLALAGWTGEWISARTLRKFVWQSGGAVFAATTPTAKPAPFAGIRLAPPTVAADSTAIRVEWQITKATRGWKAPGLDIHPTIEPVSGADRRPGDPIVVAAPAASSTSPAAAPLAAPRVSVTKGRLLLGIPTPTAPGAYRVSATLTERRFGHTVAAAAPRIVYVPGERWAEYSAPTRLVAEAGATVGFAVVVTNRGTIPWTAKLAGGMPSTESIVEPHTRVVATWIPTPADPRAAAEMVPAPQSVVLGTVPLRVGATVVLQAQIELPTAPGRWTLLVDVVDDVVGSYAALGSAPALITVDVSVPAPAAVGR